MASSLFSENPGAESENAGTQLLSLLDGECEDGKGCSHEERNLRKAEQREPREMGQSSDDSEMLFKPLLKLALAFCVFIKWW